VGTGLDNVLVTSAGKVIRIDQGGSLLWRAQGALKNAKVLNKIDEWDSLFTQNIYYKKVMNKAGYFSTDDIIDDVAMQVNKLKNLRAGYGGSFKNLVDEFGEGLLASEKKKIVKMLDTRLTLLDQKVQSHLKKAVTSVEPSIKVTGLVKSSDVKKLREAIKDYYDIPEYANLKDYEVSLKEFHSLWNQLKVTQVNKFQSLGKTFTDEQVEIVFKELMKGETPLMAAAKVKELAPGISKKVLTKIDQPDVQGQAKKLLAELSEDMADEMGEAPMGLVMDEILEDADWYLKSYPSLKTLSHSELTQALQKASKSLDLDDIDDVVDAVATVAKSKVSKEAIKSVSDTAGKFILPEVLPAGGGKGLAKQLIKSGASFDDTVRLVKRAYPKLGNPEIQVKKAMKLVEIDAPIRMETIKGTGRARTTEAQWTKALKGSSASSNLNKTARELPQKYQQSVRDYQDGKYHTLNSALRGKKMDWSRSGSTLVKTAEDIDAAMRTTNISKDMIVLRGAGSKTGKQWYEKGVGTVIQDLGYCSTTTKTNIASSFGGGGYSFEIFVPRGSKGIWMNRALKRSLYSNEAEFLLPRGTKFRVVGKKTDGRTKILRLEVIG
jgi:hypothetical protein